MKNFIIILTIIPILYWIFITWLTWKDRKKVEGKLTLVMGKAGSGKSTYMGLLVKKATKQGRPIYSNHHVLGAIKIEHTDLGKYDLNNCDVIIDEAQLHYDSRDFKNFSKENKYFFSNFRHHGVRVYILSQSFEDLDVKIRRQAQYIYIAQPFVKGILLLQKIRMKFGVSEDETDIVTLYKFNPLGYRFKLGFLAWRYFDSYSKPALEDLPCKETWGDLPKNIKEFKETKTYFKNLNKTKNKIKNKFKKIEKRAS